MKILRDLRSIASNVRAIKYMLAFFFLAIIAAIVAGLPSLMRSASSSPSFTGFIQNIVYAPHKRPSVNTLSLTSSQQAPSAQGKDSGGLRTSTPRSVAAPKKGLLDDLDTSNEHLPVVRPVGRWALPNENRHWMLPETSREINLQDDSN